MQNCSRASNSFLRSLSGGATASRDPTPPTRKKNTSNRAVAPSEREHKKLLRACLKRCWRPYFHALLMLAVRPARRA
eukprot:4782517-Alexandrium_andersonii.AAC.1